MITIVNTYIVRARIVDWESIHLRNRLFNRTNRFNSYWCEL